MISSLCQIARWSKEKNREVACGKPATTRGLLIGDGEYLNGTSAIIVVCADCLQSEDVREDVFDQEDISDVA